MITNAKKVLYPILSIIILVCLLSVFSEKMHTGIDSIENYGKIFRAVDELKFYSGDNNFYSTKNPRKELKALKKVTVNTKPVLEDRSEEIASEYKILINSKNNGRFTIHIKNDFSMLWLDDNETIDISYNNDSWNQEINEGLDPSSSYTVNNPEILQSLFKQQ